MKTLKSLLLISGLMISLIIAPLNSRAFAAIINCDRNSAPYFHSVPGNPFASEYYADPYNCPGGTTTTTTGGTGTTTTTGGTGTTQKINCNKNSAPYFHSDGYYADPYNCPTGTGTATTGTTDTTDNTTVYSNFTDLGGSGGGAVGGIGEDPILCPSVPNKIEYCPDVPGAKESCKLYVVKLMKQGIEQGGASCPYLNIDNVCKPYTKPCGGGSTTNTSNIIITTGNVDYNVTTGSTSTIGTNKTQCRKQTSTSLLTWSSMPILGTVADREAFNEEYPYICTNGGSIIQATTNESERWFTITCQLISGDAISLDRGSDCKYYLAGDGTTSTTSGTDTSTSSSTTTAGTSGTDGITTDGTTTSTSTTGTDTTTTTGTGGSVTSLYSISGIVTDENGNPLVNHTVFITYNDTTRSVTTDANGNFTFSDLSPGDYIIRPANTDTLIYFGVDITINSGDENNSVNGLNISGMSLKEVKDSEVAELLRLSSESSGNAEGESSYSSLTDWFNNVMSGKFAGSGGGEKSNLYDEFGNISNVNSNSSSYDKLFSSSSFLKLLSSGYLPLSKSYSPVALSLIPKFANNNAICGDGVAQEGETCDDGTNNGKIGQCSADCLYFGEVRFTDYDGIGNYVGKNPQNALESSSLSGAFNSLQVAGNDLSALINGGIDALSSAYENGQDWAKQKVMENTSPATRKVLKEVAVVAEEVAKYSVIGVTSLLGVAAASMQVMVYKSQWLTYTVQAGDTIDSLGNKFTMTERAMRAHNGHLKKGGLREGMKIKVRNRHFIEKDYLDQLKSVLKDGLEKRHYGHMSAKIDKMFAKK